jgi:hypothetical protein
VGGPTGNDIPEPARQQGLDGMQDRGMNPDKVQDRGMNPDKVQDKPCYYLLF